jgi:hypothetical protein
MRTKTVACVVLHALLGLGLSAEAQSNARQIAQVQIRLQEGTSAEKKQPRPAVLWFKLLPGTSSQPFLPRGKYTLLQHNRMFTPHLLVVPVGSVVNFPNADPFFHNVFSLFDGKRFDLGLYEAGSTKTIDFSREGISYIFCNIHPEMSAVVLALSTPYYAIADTGGVFLFHEIPAGDYEMHVWIEGVTQPALDRMRRQVHISPGSNDLGVLDATAAQREPKEHLNKFGLPYDKDTKPPY